MEIPEAQPEQFVEDIEQDYCEDRYSKVFSNRKRDQQMVIVVSGEHPSPSRFLKDMRKYLFNNGFVVWSFTPELMIGISEDDETQYRSKVIGVSLEWVLAEINGYTCNRGACTKLADPDDGWYCGICGDAYDGDRRIEEQHPTMYP